MDEDEVVEFLSRVREFRELGRSCIREIAQAADVLEFGAGDSIFHEGDSGDQLYAVLDGKVTIEKLTAEDTVELARLRPPTIFGELSLFDGAPRSASATAEAACMVIVVPGAVLRSLCRRFPEIYEAFLRSLSRRLRQTSRRLITLA